MQAAKTFAVVCAAAIGSVSASAQSAKWTINPQPTVKLGGAGDGTTAEFSTITGATLLPDKNIMVGDRSDYSMFIVSPNGKIIKKFGREGSGPGELKASFFMYRCGAEVFVLDNGTFTSAFKLDGTYLRKFRFTPLGKDTPYRSACGPSGQFVHYGWDKSKDGTAGKSYRSNVPAWISPGDSGAGRLVATVKGSERLDHTPQPLGRETKVAIGRNRLYVAEGESYEIKVFALDGKVLPSITKKVSPVAPRKQDVTDEIDRVVALVGEKFRKTAEADYAEARLPKTLPPYRELIVDIDDNLWVRDFARTGENVLWTIFDAKGKQIGDVLLPDLLEVYEAGKDFVLGRYIDPSVGVPEVRIYKLNRK